MATFGSTWDATSTSTSNLTYVMRAIYEVAEPKKPDTLEQWLRNRVQEICDLVV